MIDSWNEVAILLGKRDVRGSCSGGGVEAVAVVVVLLVKEVVRVMVVLIVMVVALVEEFAVAAAVAVILVMVVVVVMVVLMVEIEVWPCLVDSGLVGCLRPVQIALLISSRSRPSTPLTPFITHPPPSKLPPPPTNSTTTFTKHTHCAHITTFARGHSVQFFGVVGKGRVCN